ncbi:hypothetical protein NMG60_11015986 [Bertholletia excelsa]
MREGDVASTNGKGFYSFVLPHQQIAPPLPPSLTLSNLRLKLGLPFRQFPYRVRPSRWRTVMYLFSRFQLQLLNLLLSWQFHTRQRLVLVKNFLFYSSTSVCHINPIRIWYLAWVLE